MKTLLLVGATLLVILVAAALWLFAMPAGNRVVPPAGQPHPGSIAKADFDSLSARGELVVARVTLRSEDDLRRIRDTGVVIWTNEPTYAIVAADRQRLDLVSALGFALGQPQEMDYRLRYFRTFVATRERYEVLRSLMSDVAPARDIPTTVTGRAYDYQLTWAIDEGFSIEICREVARCEWQL